MLRRPTYLVVPPATHLRSLLPLHAHPHRPPRAARSSASPWMGYWLQSQRKATLGADMRFKPGQGTGFAAHVLAADGNDRRKRTTVSATSQEAPANPKRFLNEPEKAVQDGIDGVVWATPGIVRLDAYPDTKVVVRSDWDKSTTTKVALISGGGSGHEPAHGGFVGEGMLTAAVSGETFASPSVTAVLQAIVAVTGKPGCLLIIKSYTGDRLNFKLAAQRAKAEYGLDVEMVIACDDIATPAERGVAGTLFVHKIVGAAAAEGKSLAELKTIGDAVVDSTATLGVSLSTVSRLRPEHIQSENMEVGLGIHGEPGARTVRTEKAHVVVDMMMEDLLNSKRLVGHAAPMGYACLVNNFGSVPPIEMGILTKGLIGRSDIKLLVGPAHLMTSLDMNGFSLSLLRLTDELSRLLEAPNPVPNWPQAITPSFPAPIKAPEVSVNKYTPSQDAVVSSAIEAACSALIAAKDELNAIDAKVGDADCGTTMDNAGRRVLDQIGDLPLANPKQLCERLSEIMATTMGGSSGILLSIMFLGMANALQPSSSWQSEGAKAFRQGLQEMMDAGGAKPGMRTMLDALVPAAEALVQGQGLKAAQTAAEVGADATKTMKAQAGRAENVPADVLKGNPDPGAVAAAMVFAALAKKVGA